MKIKDRAKPKIPPVAAGSYMAVCIGVIDLGEQYSEKFKNYSNKVQIVFELPGETIEVEGKQEPRQLSREFSVATKKNSNLRTFLSAWNGKTYSDDDFMELDMFDQLGRPALLNVVLNETGEYANIESAIQIPKGIPAPLSNTATIRWDMDAWDDSVLKRFRNGYRKRLRSPPSTRKPTRPRTASRFSPLRKLFPWRLPLLQEGHRFEICFFGKFFSWKCVHCGRSGNPPPFGVRGIQKEVAAAGRVQAVRLPCLPCEP